MFRVLEILFGSSKLNYADSKAHGYSLVTFIICMILTTISIILNYVLKSSKPVVIREAIEREGVPLCTEMDGVRNPTRVHYVQSYKNLLFKMHVRTTCFGFEAATCLSATIVWDMLVAWDVIIASYSTGIYKMVMIIAMAIFLSVRHSSLYGSNFNASLNSLVKWAPLTLPLLAAYVFGIMAVTKGLCGCDFSEDIPGIVVNKDGMNLSTAWMRHKYDKHICPASKTPCFVYATLPENALNDVFINFHVNLDACRNQV